MIAAASAITARSVRLRREAEVVEDRRVERVRDRDDELVAVDAERQHAEGVRGVAVDELERVVLLAEVVAGDGLEAGLLREAGGELLRRAHLHGDEVRADQIKLQLLLLLERAGPAPR
ncbi:MAG: hypothetical protein R3F34_07370 [Planctomycetota bacterium]